MRLIAFIKVFMICVSVIDHGFSVKARSPFVIKDRHQVAQAEETQPAKPETPANEPSQESMVPEFSLQIWKASWCGACPAATAQAMSAATELGIRLELIDYDQNRDIARQIGINRLPVLMIVNDGKIQERLVGGANRADIVAKVRDWRRRWGVPESHPVLSPPPAPLPEVSYLNPVSEAGRYTTYGNRTYDWENETYSKCVLGDRCGMCVYLYNACWSYRNARGLTKTEVPSPQSSSPDEVVTEAIALMRLTPDDVVGELGSGAGGPAIRMARESGCRVEGYEIDPQKVVESRRNISEAGLSDRITIHEKDVREFDSAEHGINKVYCYLYPELLEEIAPRIQDIPLIVSAGHKIPGLDGQVLIGQCWVRDSGVKVAAK